jgi:hypothetical protein
MFDVTTLMTRFSGIKEGTIRYHLMQMQKKKGIQEPFLISPKRGLYRLNPDFKSVEEMRALVNKHINGEGTRVYQGDRQFNAKESPIQTMDSPALPIKRLFLQSILKRMEASPTFTSEDRDFLAKELPNLTTKV